MSVKRFKEQSGKWEIFEQPGGKLEVSLLAPEQHSSLYSGNVG